MTTRALRDLSGARIANRPVGIVSVCSAHPLVLRAALRQAAANDETVLIEATCNQVNHEGGYTGMTPDDFGALVRTIANEEACGLDRIILGGDHLGPNPWRDRPAEAAMAEAETMVSAYVSAGFGKIHLDCSMGCKGEPAALDDETTASRAARLASVCEETARREGKIGPLYIIGTEVPPPGGADHALDSVAPTSPRAALRTIEVHRNRFEAENLGDAWTRVIGLVVQPGVEFGNRNVVVYDRSKARDLRDVLKDEPDFVFEAHSTDYQGSAALAELVADGFAILKVGPELTFVLREALYAFDLIATDLIDGYGDRPLMHTMERVMTVEPGFWQRHYAGEDGETRFLRHYSLSDRIRYYWPNGEAKAAVERLRDALSGRRLPLPLLWQHLPDGAHLADDPFDLEEALVWRITKSLEAYDRAARPSGGSRGAL